MGVEEEVSCKVKLECQDLLCYLRTRQCLSCFILHLSLKSQYYKTQDNDRQREAVISKHRPCWAAGRLDLSLFPF